MSFPAFNFDNIRKEPLGTVYLVDDDADVRDSLRRLLESQDYRVEAYDSGEAFIAKYDPNAIAVLLLDQRMPGMPGTEVQDHLIARKAKGYYKRKYILKLFVSIDGFEEELDSIEATTKNEGNSMETAISIKTVEAHRASIMDKTNSGTVADLMRVVMSANKQI